MKFIIIIMLHRDFLRYTRDELFSTYSWYMVAGCHFQFMRYSDNEFFHTFSFKSVLMPDINFSTNVICMACLNINLKA